ncbi:hypothetical protein KP509_14G039900 [Ceratopteris richardii]|uniref:Acyl-coenzyme A thioesterase 13 n=1 Tax=Ceratopteris richardii TaxID=49495 RepID=A0A8T2TB77_CERRI|nr:hypothetical protein KP509_14G039900 [Ceratopteris richardii]
MTSSRRAESPSFSGSAKYEGSDSLLSSSAPADGIVQQWFQKFAGRLGDSVTSIAQLHEGIVYKPLKVLVSEPGRFVCSFRVPVHLTNSSNVLHQGAIASLVDNIGAAALITIDGIVRLSVDISVTYTSYAKIDDEVEVEAVVIKYTESLGVVTVNLSNKSTGQLVAQGRHTMYRQVSSL